MKQLKIRVPESEDITGSPESRIASNSIDIISRPEIHELVQKKAFELGWIWPDSMKTTVTQQDCGFLFFHANGLIQYDVNDKYFKSNQDHTEITWQESLRLTTEDVTSESDIKGVVTSESDNCLHECNAEKTIDNELTLRDRVAIGVLSGLVANSEGSCDCGYNVAEAFKYADEFIKQRGELL